MKSHVIAFVLLPLIALQADGLKGFQVAWPSDRKFGEQMRQHNWCQVEKEFWMSSRSANSSSRSMMHKVLAGRSISVVILENPSYVQYNATTGRIEGGFLVEVFEEVVRRTGMSWNTSTAYSAIPNSTKGETYDDWIHWAMNHYDVVLGDFAATAERRGQGIRFGYPFLNESPGLVAQVRLSKAPWYQTFFSWARPFSWRLWCLLLLFFGFTGLVYSYLEPESSIQYPEKGKGLDKPFEHALWLTMQSFTCNEKFKPKTRPGKVFAVSWTFTVSLIVAAYTANLASLLVIADRPTAVITGVEDAIQKNLPVCVWKGGAYDKFMQDKYPDLALKYPRHWGYHNVRNGNCAAIVKDHTLFKIDQGKAEFNADCDLGMVGNPLTEVFGSFLSKADSYDDCTDFVMDAINSVMHSMYSDGWLSEQKHKFYREVQDLTCSHDSSESGSSSSLKVSQTGGIFTLHVVISLACVVWHVLRSRPGYAAMESSSLALNSGRSPRDDLDPRFSL